DRLGKTIEDEVLSIKTFINNSKFEKIRHYFQIPVLEFLASKDKVPSKSSSVPFNEKMEAWKDYKVKKIRVLGMGRDEAWNFFNMNENLNGASPEIIEVAMEVAKECGGLPLAISKTPIGIKFKKSSIIEFLASKDRIPPKSSSATFNEIIEVLKDYKVKKTGVWGMGGVGKTTLLKEVEHEMERFDRVIMVMELEEIIGDMDVHEEISSNIATKSSLCLPNLKTM
ncbi:hypothetical protein Gorai_013141, partial [Gossypium raimondii]|nr:hypothetical protein [Gossypium raimondii]